MCLLSNKLFVYKIKVLSDLDALSEQLHFLLWLAQVHSVLVAAYAVSSLVKKIYNFTHNRSGHMSTPF